MEQCCEKLKILSSIGTNSDFYLRSFWNYLLEWNDAVKRQNPLPPSGPTVIVVVNSLWCTNTIQPGYFSIIREDRPNYILDSTHNQHFILNYCMYNMFNPYNLCYQYPPTWQKLLPKKNYMHPLQLSYGLTNKFLLKREPCGLWPTGPLFREAIASRTTS